MSIQGIDRAVASATRLLGGALVAATLVAGQAGAVTLVGVFPRNDPFGGNDKGLYGSFNGTEISSPSLAKCDVDVRTCDWENGAVAGEDYTAAFDITFDNNKEGSWSFTASSLLTHLPTFMAVKASTTWALYALDGALSGDWSTGDLRTPGGNQPNVSHISFYNGGTSPSPSPVPLPAAAWLLVAGLGGLGAVARRRRRAD
jgi:hypothetical protein